MCEEWKQEVLLGADLVTPSQGQVQWEGYRMDEVSDAYKHARYERIR